ncbi:MAG: aldo/keto reductase [Treponema sp.]|nr:aldo/keto reductase [Treponema sp.]
MIYRDFGKTGIKVPALGFGCMRLPMTEKDGKQMVDDELATPLMKRAVELGINFFDTHWFYCNFDSQRAVGAALHSIRDKVHLSSKIMLHLIEKPEDFIDYLRRALDLMQLEYIDFYHFPALSYKTYQDKVLGLKLIDQAEKAKSIGLMRHLSMSFHSDVDKMHELIDTGAFSTLLGQYNIVDRRNEDIFAYAKSKGLGTMVMGPLMGGALSDGGQQFLECMGSGASSATEMALRFVWGHPGVDMVLSGMNTLQELEENVRYAENADSIPGEERQALIERSHELKELNDLYCTNCNYCHVCPEKISIGWIFTQYLRHKIWGLDESVRKRLASGIIWNNVRYKGPEACTECGLCLNACPQKINIPSELKRVWPILSKL